MLIDSRTFQIYLIVFCVVQMLAFLSLSFALLVPLVMVCLVFMIFLYYQVQGNRYPVTTIIFVKRKGGFSVVFDRATRVIEKGTKRTYYRLKGAKKDIKPSDFGNIIESSKGLFSILYAPTSDEYAPITKLDEGKLQVMDEDMKFWHAQGVKKAYERFHEKQSVWMQYYPIIAIAVLGIMMAIILYANSQYMTGVTAQLSSAAGTLADAVRGLASAGASAPLF